MAFRDREELTGGSVFHDASRGLLRMAGGWGNVSGPGLFMVRTLVGGTLNAMSFGLVGGAFGGAIWGTATLPFMIAAVAGFVFGAVGFYKDAMRQAMLSLERYPRVLQLHLDANYPWARFDRYTAGMLARERFEGSWVMKSMLVTSWLTAQPALDQISERREQAVVDEGVQSGSTDASDAASFEDQK